jgi:hypothetical protein
VTGVLGAIGRGGDFRFPTPLLREESERIRRPFEEPFEEAPEFFPAVFGRRLRCFLGREAPEFSSERLPEEFLDADPGVSNLSEQFKAGFPLKSARMRRFQEGNKAGRAAKYRGVQGR